MSLARETQQVRTGSLGWMIQRIARRLDQAMEQRLRAHGMTLQHFAVMMTSLETEGLSQTEIGVRFGMAPYAISRAVDHLETAGLLERRAHPTSRRTHTIHTTKNGRALSRDLFSIVREVNDELARPLSASERDQFRQLLERLL